MWSRFIVFFKFGLEYAEHVVNSVLFEVSLFHEHGAWCGYDALRCLESDGFDSVDDPWLYFVLELIKVDVLFFWLVAVDFAEDIDGIFCYHAGELDVVTVLADGEAHLVWLEVHLSFPSLFVECDGRDVGWAESALYEEACVVGVVDDVNVFVVQLLDDAVDAACKIPLMTLQKSGVNGNCIKTAGASPRPTIIL